MSLHQIMIDVRNRDQDIIQRLKPESVAVYTFLMEEFHKGDVTSNPLFQFIYRSFYRLDQAGLSEEFKIGYFEMMEARRNDISLNPLEVVTELYTYKRLRGDHSYQFSFTSKLLNTINPSYPIYDSEVARVFKLPTYYLKDETKRLSRYMDSYETLQQSYHLIIENEYLLPTLEKFDDKFHPYEIPLMKKLDFIFWSYGKLLK